MPGCNWLERVTIAGWVGLFAIPLGSSSHPDAQRRLTGLVVGDDGAPVARASLALRNPGTVHNAVANDQGEFVFTDVAPGRYSLTGSSPGFVSMEYGASKFGGAGNPIVVAENGFDRLVRLRLFRAAGITGSVRHANGAPAGSTAVLLLRQRVDINGIRVFRQHSARRADAIGRFAFVDLPPGKYLLRGATPDPTRSDADEPEIDTFFPSGDSELAATSIALVPGETRDHADITLLRGNRSSIVGRLLDPSGSALVLRYDSVGLAEVIGNIVRPIQTSPLIDETIFSFSRLGAGDYLVTALADSTVTGLDRLAASSRISLRIGERREVTLVLEPPLIVNGQIKFRGSGTVPDLSTLVVELQPISGSDGVVSRARPGSDGRIQFSNLQPGRYRVRVLRGNESAGRIDWFLEAAILDGTDVSDEGFELTAGHRLERLEILLTNRFGRVTGSVTDTALVPRLQYTVLVFPQPRELWRADTRRVRCVRPATDGSFSVPGLPPGHYLLALVLDPDPNECLQHDMMVRASTSSIAITVSNERTETLRLVVN